MGVLRALSPLPRTKRRGEEAYILHVNRKAFGQRERVGLHLCLQPCVSRFATGCKAVEDLGHHAADLAELGDAETARGTSRRADADAGGDGRLLRIERYTIFVGGDVGTPQSFLGEVGG